MIKRFLLFCCLLPAFFVGQAMSIVELHDTVCWQPYYHFKGVRFELPAYQAYISQPYMNVVLEYRDKEACTKYKMRLAIVPVEMGANHVIYDTIAAGDTYNFYGELLTETGVYSKTVTGACNCTGDYTLHLKVLTTDTVREMVTICENELPYRWHGQTLKTSGEYVYAERYPGWDVNKVVYLLDLTVLEVAYIYSDTTIYEGEKYWWRGNVYTKAGTYTDTLQRTNGCDSVLVMTLNVLKNDVNLSDVDILEQCADVADVVLTLNVTGLVDSLYLNFDAEGKAIGLRDVAMRMPVNNTIHLHYENMRAGKYKAVLTGVFRSMRVFQKDVLITFLYPSFVLEQRWNDVVAVLTHKYNGGYHFTAFQWYKDGQELVGETQHYLHQPLEIGAEYSALLTDSRGVQLMSCPLVAVDRTDISIYPTVLQGPQRVCCRVYELADVYVYDTTGNLLYNTQVQTGDTYLQMPEMAGVYLVKIITESNQERDVKIVVL